MNQFNMSEEYFKNFNQDSQSSSEQLKFHMPASLIANIQSTLEAMKVVEAIKVVEALRIVEAMKIAQVSQVIEIQNAIERQESQASGESFSSNSNSIADPSFNEIKDEVKIPEDLKIEEVQKVTPVSNANYNHEKKSEEHINEAVPFLSLNIKNAPVVYKIGKSFLIDIIKKKKNFGFSCIFDDSNDLNLLAIGSFINYSLNKPVLIVVQNLNDKIWNQYRPNFKAGSLWKWQTCDWGNLCFIDYPQINRRIEEFNLVNLNFITQEFAAVLWALPRGDLQEKLPQISLTILRQLSSVTITVKSGETTSKCLSEAGAYFQCFEVPVKGILRDGVR